MPPEQAVSGQWLLVFARGIEHHFDDALHVAMAAVHGVDYLLTWNCKHIVNATMRDRIEELCREAGFEPPVICTPFELGKE